MKNSGVWRNLIDREALHHIVDTWRREMGSLTVYSDHLRHVRGVTFRAVFGADPDDYRGEGGNIDVTRLRGDALRLVDIPRRDINYVCYNMTEAYVTCEDDIESWLHDQEESIRELVIDRASPVLEVLLQLLGSDAYDLVDKVLEEVEPLLAEKLEQTIFEQASRLPVEPDAIRFLWPLVGHNLAKLVEGVPK